MDREKLFTNLETSTKLRAAGLKQDSFANWGINPYTPTVVKLYTSFPDSRDNLYSAFTFSELWELMPLFLEFDRYKYVLSLRKSIIVPVIVSYRRERTKYIVLAVGENPSEAIATLLLECIEKGYMKIENGKIISVPQAQF